MRSKLLLTFALLWPGSALAATVTVQPGDTLTRLAVRHGTAEQALVRANPALRTGALIAGARLNLPSAPPPRRWTVRRGDTLSLIARHQGTTLAALLAANPGLDPRRPLLVGQRLTVPSQGTITRQPVTPTVRAASIRVTPVLPVQGRVTTPFLERHPSVDLAAPVGTPVRAARPGVVTESRFDAQSGWGWTVVVDHGDGMLTRYSHNSENLAQVGARVEAGQVITRVGSTGNSTGPHLDYRMTVQGTPVDPLSLY